MMMVFAVVFALIIIGQIFLFKKTPATQPKTDAAPTSQSSATTTQSATPATADLGSGPGQAAKTPQAATPVEAKAASSETETTVENDLYKIVFTNRGGQVKSWILKKYKDDDGHPLDLVNKETVKFGLPLSLYTYDQNLRNQINSALYVASATGNLSAPGELGFDYSNGGVTVHKSFAFGSTYVISVETSVTQNGQTVPALPIWPAAFGDETTAPGLCLAEDRVHGRRQGGAAGAQEGQRRQHFAWTV